jgi:signal transduction histidine kinase/ActR/RegA family two-component response regulator
MAEEWSSGPTGPETVAAWRVEVLERVFRYMFYLLAVLLAVEALLSIESGQWHALPALSVAVLLQGLAAFASGFAVRARAFIFTAAACVGLGFGLPALGFAFPVPFIVAAMTLTLLALCVGYRFALGSLFFIVAVVLVAGAYVCFLRATPLPLALAEQQPILDPNRFFNWLRVTGVFAAVGVAIIGAVGLLVQRLEQAVRHNASLFGSLEQASRDKIRALEEREVLHDKIRRSNDLQLLGMLSATVAHDFNNLLMVILGNAHTLKLDAQGQAKEDVADIEHAGEQAADLCRRLLTLAGERMSGDEVAELNRFVEGELPILRRLVTSRVRVEWNPGPPLWLKCARTEMRQALLNLCANARDAMPRGGVLRVSTTTVVRAAPGGDVAATFACLAIADDGSGMDAATRERIFEPFFTTKGKTKGTGLGMTLVSAAVERQAGFLELETAPGRGTTFSLFFPVVENPAPEVAAPPASSRSTLSGNETVLVVDDDEGARRMLVRYLQKSGYSVLTASDGQTALEVLRNAARVELIISDAMMPRMGGRALFDVVSRERPALPFLFCSGFPAGTVAEGVLDAPHRALLSKPFTEETLLLKVRELLERPLDKNAPAAVRSD